jgi:hypothetical protein
LWEEMLLLSWVEMMKRVHLAPSSKQGTDVRKTYGCMNVFYTAMHPRLNIWTYECFYTAMHAWLEVKN